MPVEELGIKQAVQQPVAAVVEQLVLAQTAQPMPVVLVELDQAHFLLGLLQLELGLAVLTQVVAVVVL
jgi:hypothetical protein